MEKKTMSAPRESLGFLLLQLRRAMRTEFDRLAKGYDVSASQWCVLASMHWGEAATVSDIARFLIIDATGVTRLVDRLQQKGLVRRTDHKTDRRINTVSLTAAGQKLMRKLEKVAVAVDDAFLGRIASNEANQFLSCVKRMLGVHNGDKERNLK